MDDAPLPSFLRSLLDTTKPTVARVYDASLGGKDNFDVDRRVWERIRAAAPHQGDVSQPDEPALAGACGGVSRR